MKPRFSLIAAVFGLLLAAPAAAQLGVGLGGNGTQIGVPGVPGVQDLPTTPLPRPLDPELEELLGDVTELSQRQLSQIMELADDRVRRINRLVRRNRDVIERDANGEPARRGELIILTERWQDAMESHINGYGVIETGTIEGLDIGYVRVAVPDDVSLAEAEEELSELFPDLTVTADNLYFQSGGTAHPVPPQDRTVGFSRGSGSAQVGMIDGAPASAIPVTAMRGFATGGGQASDHGSAVASLLRSAGAPRILAADVYGSDPAGGNALAIAQALGWLAEEGAQVVTISLVGPDNPVLARAIRAARQRGIVVVAAVGNDGPAAPPAYPASYEGVVAVTGVDRRERALIEAGRALHLDYAAPGADIYGLDRRGRSQRLRGTSYATPLAAARIARALASGSNWRNALDSEAHDLGQRGADDTYGRGLVCRGCGARN